MVHIIGNTRKFPSTGLRFLFVNIIYTRVERKIERYNFSFGRGNARLLRRLCGGRRTPSTRARLRIIDDNYYFVYIETRI